MHRALGEVAKRSGEPEASFRRPVHQDLVGEVDDACLGEAAQDDALHHADEWALVPEVGGDRDDAGWFQAVAILRPRSTLRDMPATGLRAHRTGSRLVEH